MTEPTTRDVGNELARRWAVAVVGVPAVLGLLWYGGWALGGVIALFAWLGARETYRFAAQKGTRAFSHIGGPAAAALVLVAAWRPTFVDFAPWALGIIALTTVLASLAALALRAPDEKPLGAISVTVFGVVYAGLSLSCIPLLHALPTLGDWGAVNPVPWVGLAVVALPLAATWIGDALAFFAGTAWGRRKILPRVSPAKSWVGSWAGLVGATGAAAAWYWVVEGWLPGMPVSGVFVACGVGAALGVGAQVGDFVESLLKREAGVKDSGTLFPGHGGVLDRLDALVMTLPLAYAAFVLLERGF